MFSLRVLWKTWI